MSDREKVIDAFERCFCARTASCPGCYKEGPGFGYVCRQSLCDDVLALIKEQQEEIQNLRRENNSILTQFHEWVKEQGNKTKELLQEIKDLRLAIAPATAGDIVTAEQHEGDKQ